MSCDYCWPGNCCGGPNCKDAYGGGRRMRVADANEEIIRLANEGKRVPDLRAEIERLRAELADPAYSRVLKTDIDDQNAYVERLRAALKPFADLAKSYEDADVARAPRYRDEGRMSGAYHEDCHRVSIGLGECRAARLALEQNGPTEADMRAFSASDAACYRWPDDTVEHRALRSAYIAGAADCGGNK